MSNNYKNILFVTLHYLDGVGGGVFASRAYINAFAEIFSANYSMTLLYPESDVHKIYGIDRRVTTIPVRDNSSKYRKIINLFTGKVHRYNDKFKEIIKSRHFDYIVFDNSRVSFRLIDIARKSGSKIITIHHNCELEYLRDNTTFPIKPILLHWAKEYESDAVKKSDLNFVLTSADKSLILRKYSLNESISKKIEILGVFESQHNDLPVLKNHTISEELKNFIITGNLGAKQSNMSLIYWLQEYYPSFKSIFPDSRLTIAGKNPTSKLTQLCQNLNIRLIPSPPAMEPLLEQADCYVCPTCLGGGLKLRLMDGLKFGLPVITHTVSARGYEDFIQHGTVFPYNSKETFISSCKNLKNLSISKKEVQLKYSSMFSFEKGCNRLDNLIKAHGLAV